MTSCSQGYKTTQQNHLQESQPHIQRDASLRRNNKRRPGQQALALDRAGRRQIRVRLYR